MLELGPFINLYNINSTAAALINTLKCSGRHLFLIRGGMGTAEVWALEWDMPLDDLIGVPVADGNTLRMIIRQVTASAESFTIL